MRRDHLTFIMILAVLGCGPPADSEQPTYGETMTTADGPAHREHGRDSDDGRGSYSSDRKADGACGPFPAYYYQYLDDTACIKVKPSNGDRSHQCPTDASDAEVRTPDGRTVHYKPASVQPIVDTQTLGDIVPDDVKMTLILVRRVHGVPHYRYLSNGTHNDIIQPWSATKFMAMANGAAGLRAQSTGLVGLNSMVDDIPLGDLGTVIHNYDEREYTSNALSAWFHDLGGRDQANQLIHAQWLNRPLAESFGGNYGASPARLGYTIIGREGRVHMVPRKTELYVNQLSTYTMAEFLKRLVMHREDEATRMPHLSWTDVDIILNGAPNSIWFSNTTPQGMSSDTAVYIQQALNMPELEARTHGHWRIFSKLGHGITSRGAEFVHNAYACLPAVGHDGEIEKDVGKEFILSFYLNGPTNGAVQTDTRIAQIYRRLVNRIMDGTIK
ncbi:MAG: hypothetical protein VX589_18045 [Myxococcota bacterium]|nr:hypothetical protein [Myxococcota bacterium]